MLMVIVPNQVNAQVHDLKFLVLNILLVFFSTWLVIAVIKELKSKKRNRE